MSAWPFPRERSQLDQTNLIKPPSLGSHPLLITSHFQYSHTGFMQLLVEYFLVFVIVSGFFCFLNVGLDLLFLQTRWMAARQTAMAMGSVWPDTVTASQVSWVQTVPKVRHISWRIRLALIYDLPVSFFLFLTPSSWFSSGHSYYC